MPLFLDACALVKAYVREPRGSDTMADILACPSNWGGLVISDHVALEVHAVLARKLRKRILRRRTYTKASLNFGRDYTEIFHIVDVKPERITEAIRLVKTYERRGIQPLDLIHLVTAEHLARTLVDEGPFLLVTADHALLQIASERGLASINPESSSARDVRRLTHPSHRIPLVPADGA